MKILKVVLLSLAALFVVLAVAAVIIVNTVDLNRFRPQIVEQASKALARPFDFRDARLSIGFNGIGVRLSGIAIGEDPAFGAGQFFTVKSVSVGVDPLGYLLRRQISITGIVIDAPCVTVIKAKDGAVNAATIAKQPDGTGEAKASGPQAPAVALPALFISSLKGQNGSVTYIDRSFDPPLAVRVDELSFTVNRLSLSDPFPFSVQASVFGKDTVRVEGKCQLDLKNNGARVTDLKVSSDLSRIVLKKIPQEVPLVPAQALPAELKGALDVSVPELVAGAAGMSKLNAEAVLANGELVFKEMGAPIKTIAADAAITEKDITVKSFSAAIGEGSLRAGGWLKDYAGSQSYDFSFTAGKLSIPDLYSQAQLPVKAAGLISASGQVKGKGFTPQALRDTLAGQATVEVSKAVLKDINVLNVVLDRLSVIPGLGESVKAGLPEAYKRKLEQKDTAFDDFKVPVTIAGGRVTIAETSISSESLFTFKAGGEAGLDGSYSVEGSFLLAQDLSKAIVSRVKQMQYLLNGDQMIMIPLKVSGKTGAKMEFTVDAAYVTRKLLENQARQQILKGLDKYLGGQGDSQGQDGQPSAQQPQGSGQSDAEKAVDNLLKNLFK